MSYTLEQIRKSLLAKGYIWFSDPQNKGFDLNIVGIRNSEPGTKVTNLFDDRITVSYLEKGTAKFHSWPATTDPGTKGVLEHRNPDGVARLVPGQYRSSHTLGLHQGKYEALRQQKPMSVYRDSNKDMLFEESRIQTGIFGINIHKAGRHSTWVENWSEGCQVFQKTQDFEEFMKICRQAARIHGPSFTYTLLESKDLKSS
jgi:hypothetical protein